MPCGADWATFSFVMDSLYELGAYQTQAWYATDPAGFAQYCYESGLSREAILADVLADQMAGYK